MTHVAVVRAGMVGAALADALVRTGASVTVLDCGAPGAGTSGTSLARLNANRKLPRPGCRTRWASRSRHPIVGRLPVDNACLMVTHSGMTLAPPLARLAAAEIRTGEPGDDLAPYRPQRFADPVRVPG